ncbi:10854_t:CDS:2 [Paraglomus occultum]|uniref:10854_t:CDS:1 n=1 Tax=Paraglomus occultum TaxID=144539 RepID=A0A9N8YTU5_9GLOM|nr:10854_t:CDS:2 [Paraglomus occultum]
MTSNLPVMLARNFLGVVRANYEDDDSNSPSPTSPTSSSVPASPNTATPTSSSLPNAVSSFFSGQPTIPQFHRRASESGPADNTTAEPKRLLARRYTLPPRIDPFVKFGTLQGEDTGNRVPMARFWEAGGKEDSSVQLAMEHVQFGF